MKKINFLNKMFWLFLAFGLTTAVFNACGGDSNDEPGVGNNSPTISVTNPSSLTQEVYADNLKGNSEVSFTTTGSWTSSISEVSSSPKSAQMRAATNAPAWISISPESGNAGNHSIEIRLTPNNTAADRTAIITISSGGAEININVTQMATNAPVAVTGITLNKPTLTLGTGSSETLIATVAPNNATDRTVTWTSSANAVATVDATGKVTAVAAGTATITARAGDKTATCVVTVTAQAPVTPTTDPGVVINGVKWATRNVDNSGTFAATPESAGKFYQWNRKVAWNATGTVSGWNNSYTTGTSWTKANDPSPAGWRVPTFTEIQSLLNTSRVSNVWTTQNGVNGRRFTDLSNGNSLFLPAVGTRNGADGTLNGAGRWGYYWSSTALGHETYTEAYTLDFDSGIAYWMNNPRRYGFTVRSVAE